MAKSSKSWDEQHAERVAYRREHNGQPNGYRPVTEAELQLEKVADELDPNFGKVAA